MATTPATSVRGYLAALAPDRRDVLAKVRAVIRKNLPRGYEEAIVYGMIGYAVPLARYPDTYNGQPLTIAVLGAQKSHLALYIMSVYGDPKLRAWFERAWHASGKKLDMGKSCLRFRRVEDVALEVIGEAIARVSVEDFIATYERSRRGKKSRAGKRTRAQAKAEPTAKARPRLNATWHRAHVMAERATLQERVAWHVAHASRCGCREMPRAIAAIVAERASGKRGPRR